MGAETLLDELKRYVAFGAEDEAALQALAPRARPHFARFADDFYAHILAHPGASRAIRGGAEQVARLTRTLHRWMEELVEGPWDEAYYARRARIGRRHVEIQLPQQYMFTAVDVIRGHLTELIVATAGQDRVRSELHAINKILDIELAIMLHTYREDYLAHVQRSERLATFGQLAASIGHELRNPLGVMESSVFLLRGRAGEDERVTRHLDRIQGQIRLANRIIGELLDLVRERPPDRRPTPLRALVEEAMELVVERPAGAQLVLDLPDDLPPVLVDPDQLRQALVNLVANGLEAAGAGGEVGVSARRHERVVALQVSDTGPGIDPKIRARLFEPLVTTKMRGIGLGLALCRRLLENNGGAIRLVTGPRAGACFELTLAIPEGA